MRKLFFLVVALVLTQFANAEDTMMKSDTMKSDKSTTDASMMKSDTMMKADAVQTAAMDPSAYSVKGLGKQVVAFTSEKDAQMLAKTQAVVYFFAATWCPTCQATYKDLQVNAMALPKDVTLIFVNYDKAPDLKKKYGVTSQHTFVQIGPMGEKKMVWSGSTTVADILKNTSRMM